MSTEQQVTPKAALTVENIGGIDHAAHELSPGITVLAGRNATNRTSLLQAIMAACGSDRATLKADADEGSVVLEIDDETYTREYTRHNDTVVADGDPYLDDPTVADLFAFLLESNEARRAVALGEDLRELMLRPVDTDRIEAEIANLESERDDLETRLEELDALERELPDLEAEKQALIDEIEDLEADLEEATETVEDMEADLESLREAQTEQEETLEELVERRNDLQDIRSRIDSEEESIEALESDRTELESDMEEYSRVPADQIDAIESEIETVRQRIREVDRTIDELGSIIQFNDDLLGESQHELPGALDGDGAAGAVTDQLVDGGDQLTCWTCGSEVRAEAVEETLDRLRSVRSDLLDRRSELEDELDEHKTEKLELTERNRQHDQITESLDQIEDELERRRERIEEYEEQAEELAEEVEELEQELEETDAGEYDDVLAAHEEQNRLEFELDRRRSDLESIETEIADVEAELEQRESIEDEREAVQEELTELRTRVEQLETEAIEQFNEHMESILGLLEYDNLERIWIERTEIEGRTSGPTESRFDMHVVRSTSAGRVYEDAVDHLSESEREVTGLVFALAGFLVHEVYEEVPFMLLDSIEAIDADRIAQLVEYVAEYPEFLVVSLLEEDAAALDEAHDRITSV